MSKEITVTKENFQKEVLESKNPVLVDFWANWCGPCKMLAPELSQLAEEHQEIKVCKVNVDEQMELAQQFGVMSIPYLVIFKDGKMVTSTVGYQQKEEILELFKGIEK